MEIIYRSSNDLVTKVDTDALPEFLLKDLFATFINMAFPAEEKLFVIADSSLLNKVFNINLTNFKRLNAKSETTNKTLSFVCCENWTPNEIYVKTPDAISKNSLEAILAPYLE